MPADLKLLEIAQLYTVESSLTGESLPVEKNLSVAKKVTSLGEQKNMAFLGTVVSRGHGVGTVVATGMQTEFGKIAHMVQEQKNEPTPLQKQLSKLSKVLAILVVAIAGILFATSMFTGRDILEMFLLSVSLAVSVIPEGLPAVITLTLALGVQRIAKQHAIIRKLAAAETLGSVDTICTDKTGTLTQNEMTVKVLWVNGELMNIDGNGYDPTETFPVDNKELHLLLQTGVLCNNAALIERKGTWSISGDPTEAALLTLAEKGGLHIQEVLKKYQREKELIFDSERKRMSVLCGGTLYTKGAPDSVLTACTHIQLNDKILALTPYKKKELLKVNESLARKAYRVLGIAMKPTKELKEEGMIFLGLVAMIDPPRLEVKAAIEICKKAHIRTVMITGDHALTAQAIGKEIGLYKAGDKVVTGDELESMSMEKLRSIVDSVSIFARVNPPHKVKILEALQKNGHTVSMTGDGVNDAPALKRADIGVAMGITGTDVSKEASDMVLMDDNFATIVATVESGRTIYRNIKKFIRFLLSANFDEVLVVSVVFLAGYPLPFLPLQLLWVNLLTDALPAIALGTDTSEKDIMNLKPSNPQQSIFKDLLHFSILAGLLSAAISLFLYFEVVGQYSIEHTRTMMFTVIVVFELMLVFSVRFVDKSYFTSFFKNKFLLFSVLLSSGIHLLGIYLPFLQQFLQTDALGLKDWLLIIGLCVAGIAVIEVWKKFQKPSAHV